MTYVTSLRNRDFWATIFEDELTYFYLGKGTVVSISGKVHVL